MIAVIAKAGQAALADEFFQLFKTPWELWRPGRAYDAVIVTTDEIPVVRTRLVLAYGAGKKSSDSANGIRPASRRQGGLLSYRGRPLPIYGDLLTFDGATSGLPVATIEGEPAALRVDSGPSAIVRFGYDLFEELRFLLSTGQPADLAHVPTVDLHIGMLRASLQGAGIGFVEIPPAPAGYEFVVCLTHDIDFVGIRDHRFDHTMWGFLHRSTVGALASFFRRRLKLRRLLKIWKAVASLPFVYLGWAKDFWNPFEWYMRVEKNLPATYFFIPFKRRAGEHVSAGHAARRATAYDITDIPQWTTALMREKCELGVHGIDGWHSAEKGKEELGRITGVTGQSTAGVRMHWLLQHAGTHGVLEQAGYAYDSSAGYNETIGYRNGTGQVFRPASARTLLELPLHIQDGALFYPQRLNLSEPEAWSRCLPFVENARQLGGVLTVLWHDRSHGPERFWGDFYQKLVDFLKSRKAWFATGGQAVGWFQKRRDVRFEEVEAEDGSLDTRLNCGAERIDPPLTVRVHRGDRQNDLAWTGETPVFLNQTAALCSLS